MKNPIVVDVTVNGKRVNDFIVNTEDLFRVIHEILPVEVAMELDDFINQLEIELQEVTDQLSWYVEDEKLLTQLKG